MQKKAILLLFLLGFSLSCNSAGTTPLKIPTYNEPASPTPTTIVPTHDKETKLPDLYLSEVEQERLLQLLFTNGGCDLPCLWGMVPGEMSWDYAKAFLNTIHKNDAGVYDVWYEDNSLPAYSVPLQFIDTKNRAILAHLAVTVGNQKLRRINLYAEANSGSDLSGYFNHYSVPWVFSQLGPPSQIYFNIFKNDLEKYPAYNFLLLYQPQKATFWYSGISNNGKSICPQVRENGEIIQLQISVADPESNLEIYPPDWEFWSLKDKNDFLTTEELFGIDQEQFYQQILNNKDCCFWVK